MTKRAPERPTTDQPAAAPQSPSPLWTQYRVTWNFLTRVCGSTPADPEVINAWLEAREPRVKPAGALSIQEINEEVMASIERGEEFEPQNFSYLVFQRNAGHLVMRYSTVRAHIKDCARVLSAQYIGRVQGERAFSTRVINGVYLDEREYWLPLRRPDGAFIAEHDGAQDKMVHGRGPHGEPLNALKRIQFVEPPTVLTFTLKVLGRSVSEVDLHHLFEYGGVHGYAGERSDGEGRYEYAIERIDAPTQRATTSHGVGAR
jgi:hypothetical protein